MLPHARSARLIRRDVEGVQFRLAKILTTSNITLRTRFWESRQRFNDVVFSCPSGDSTDVTSRLARCPLGIQLPTQLGRGHVMRRLRSLIDEPELWLSNCLTVISALRGSLSGFAQGMKSHALSSKVIRRGVRPCRLCSDAMASTVAHTALETEATRRESITALLPLSACSTIVP